MAEVAYVFIESAVFRKQREAILSDEEFRALQNVILRSPEQGKLIRGSGGLRKIRFAVKGKGKSGGVRVIYFIPCRNE